MRRVVSLALAAFSLAACAGSEVGARDDITVGAVTFAENQIVGEMYAQMLESKGIRVERRFNFPDRETLLPALESGAVDVAPEYLASLLTALDPNSDPSSDPSANVEALEPLLDESGAQLLAASTANDTNAIVVAAETAQEYDLETVSDLRPHGRRLVFGGPPECPDREFCLKGLREVYGIEFKEFKPLDAGGSLTVAALTGGEIDVALLFSTSGVIAERGWVLLEDDKGLQAAENITPVVRDEVVTDDVRAALEAVSAALTTETMTELNAQVEVEGRDFRDVATEFLVEQGLIEE
ncbi:MAG: ABC transporter substrate-binding protein [Actinobacteria bacterium]|nr:ABC transporter substrate-binding protein [Actinomycetota bacterium]